MCSKQLAYYENQQYEATDWGLIAVHIGRQHGNDRWQMILQPGDHMVKNISLTALWADKNIVAICGCRRPAPELGHAVGDTAQVATAQRQATFGGRAILGRRRA